MEKTLEQLLRLAEATIDPSTNNGDTELHGLYIETAALIINKCNSPKSEKFEPKIMGLLLANQNTIFSESDPRWPMLFGSWISILDKIKTVPQNPRDKILSLIDNGMKNIIGI